MPGSPPESARLTGLDKEPDILDTADAGPATIRGSMVRTAGYGVAVLLSVASAPLLVRHLGITDFGRYMTVVSLVALAAGVSDAGVTSIAVREWSTRSGAQRERLMRNLLGLRLVLAVAGGLAVTAFASLAGYSDVLVLGTLLAGVGMVLMVMQQAYAVPLQAELRLGWVTIADVLRQVLTVAGIVLLVVIGAGLLPFIALAIPASLGAFVLTLVIVRRSAALRPAFEPATWWHLVVDTLPVAAAVALHHLYLRIVIVLMSLLAADVQTGYFAGSYRVTEVVVAVAFLVGQTALPVLSRAAHNDRARLTWAVARLAEASVILGTGVALLLIASAPLVADVLIGAGEDADEVAAVLRVQSFAVLGVCLTVVWNNTLFVLRRHADLVLTNVVGLAATVVLVVLLLPAHEARGAAAGAALGEFSLMACSAVLLLRAGIDIRPVGRLAVRVVPAAIAAGAVLLVPGLPVVADVVLVGGAYAALLFVLRAVPEDVKQGALVLLGRRGGTDRAPTPS